MSNAYFIVVEGTDGTGKTTQINILKEKFEKLGHSVYVADFPQFGKKSAGVIENYLNGKYGAADDVDPKIASSFYAIDRFDASFDIRAHMQKGGIVLSDRWVTANMGHQGGKIRDKNERRKMFEWIANLEYDFYHLPKPHLTVILYVEPELTQRLVDKRGARKYLNGGVRDIHEDDIDHLRGAAESYKHMAEILEATVLIDCMDNGKLRSVEDIHAMIWAEVEKVLKKG